MPTINTNEVDFLEAGSGPLVVLLHSSVAGARQWRKLMETLASSFHVRAVNLIGYGRTPSWRAERPMTLDDEVDYVAAAVPPGSRPFHLVGHSFGAAVAMRAARRFGAEVGKLVLLEPNPFDLLRQHGCTAAIDEVLSLRRTIRTHGERGDWEPAAERFADYWGGDGTWAAMDADRRRTFTGALAPNFHEWDAIMSETTPLAEWVEALPRRTLVVFDPNTVLPIRKIVWLMQQAAPWRFATVQQGGHMAPLTRPDLVNPLIQRFLEA